MNTIKEQSGVESGIEEKKLYHGSHIPLYYQLKEILLLKIQSQEWREGELIPSENELQKIYNVSRATIRRTIDLLVQDGFVRKQRGRGTFVRKPRIEEILGRVTSFSEEMVGKNARKEVLSAEYGPPILVIQKILNLYPDEKVLYLKRLLILDEKPLGIFIEYIPERFGVGLENDFSQSLFAIMETRGIEIGAADQTIESTMSSYEDMKLLRCKDVFPVLLIKRLVYTISGDPLQYVKAVYHGDRYRYQLKMFRNQTGHEKVFDQLDRSA